MEIFSPDSAFMRGLSDMVDGIWINVLMVVTSLPLITIGASLTAGHDAARRVLGGQGKVTANYFRAFKTNFIKATLIWLVFGPTLAALIAAWIMLQIPLLLIAKFAFSIIWIICFEWVWALQARFENPVRRTLLNAMVFGVVNWGRTLAMAAIDLTYLALIIASWFYMPQGLFLLFTLGYGSLILVHTPLLNGVLIPYAS